MTPDGQIAIPLDIAAIREPFVANALSSWIRRKERQLYTASRVRIHDQ